MNMDSKKRAVETLLDNYDAVVVRRHIAFGINDALFPA